MLSRLLNLVRKPPRPPLRCLQCGSDRLRVGADEKFLACARCDYRHARWLVPLEHARFATAGGTRNAGQSTWCAVFFREVSHFNGAADLVALPGLGAPLAVAAVSLLEAGQVLSATVPELPVPNSYLCLDAPPRRAVHLYDFAGEVMNVSPEDSSLARWHRGFDGYLVFLDPLGAEYPGGEGRLEGQAARVVEFLGRVGRRERGGERPPLAVCLPKCDALLWTAGGSFRPPALHGADAAQFIAAVRPTKGRTPVAERSRLCRRFLYAAFPEWREVVAALADWPRVEYFPLWVYEPGQSRPGNLGPVAPFGVTEPVEWLIEQTAVTS